MLKNEIMKTPLISVVMPVYNSGTLIHQTIQSILNQTYTNFEFIIIDDASKDNTLKTIKNYQKKDKRIKIIQNKQNKGISITSNIGLNHARGKYIAMMDHDDLSHPERFEKQIYYLEQHKDIFLVGTGYYCIDINNKIINRGKIVTNLNKLKNDSIIGKWRICHPSIMFKNNTNIRYRAKIYYAQDVDFFLQLIADGKKLTNLKEILFYYRVHKTQTSMEKRNKQLLFAKKAIDLYNEKIKFGKDSYDKFDPKTILELNANTSDNKDVIASEIFYNFHKQNYKYVKLYSKKYFKLYGHKNRILLYYIISFFPKKLIQEIIKLKRRFI